MKLVGNNVGLQIVVRRNFNPGGKVITPPELWKKTDEAVVRYLGDDVDIPIKVGDRVIYDRYAKGTMWNILGKDIFIVNQDSVEAVVEV